MIFGTKFVYDMINFWENFGTNCASRAPLQTLAFYTANQPSEQNILKSTQAVIVSDNKL